MSLASAASRARSTASRVAWARSTSCGLAAGCRPPAAGTGRRSPAPAGSAGWTRAASGRRTARRPRGRPWRRARPRRAARAADRGLELVADVGDEVAADLLDPAGLGAVLDEEQHVLRAERRDPGAARRARCRRLGPCGQLELGLADHAVAAHLPGQVEQLGLDELAARDQPVATAAGEVLTTASAASRTTPLDRSTERTSATPREAADRSSRRRRHRGAAGAPRGATAHGDARQGRCRPRTERGSGRRVHALQGRWAGKHVPTDGRLRRSTADGQCSPRVAITVHLRLRTSRWLRTGRTPPCRPKDFAVCATPSTRSSTRSPTSWSR